MQPIGQLQPSAARRMRGVLFDIDDTVLDHGRLSIESLTALYKLQAAGLLAVGVTGRPVAWGQVLVRQWPVDAVLTENGPLWVVQRQRRVVTLDRLTVEERNTRRADLMALVWELRARFPQLEPADDAAVRLADFTFDIGEAVVVPPEVIADVTRFATARGAKVTRSSIHLHISLDGDDKATGTLKFLSQVHGLDPTASRYEFAFIGDSENDRSCFAAFETTVAVANLRGRPTLPPRYITSGKMGAGFAEFVERLLLARSLRA